MWLVNRDRYINIIYDGESLGKFSDYSVHARLILPNDYNLYMATKDLVHKKRQNLHSLEENESSLPVNYVNKN